LYATTRPSGSSAWAIIDTRALWCGWIGEKRITALGERSATRTVWVVVSARPALLTTVSVTT
jgi:hypothetical protein